MFISNEYISFFPLESSAKFVFIFTSAARIYSTKFLRVIVALNQYLTSFHIISFLSFFLLFGFYLLVYINIGGAIN